jgi:hypothetical protein
MSFRSRWKELQGEFGAWFRQGAIDLHNRIVPAFPANGHGVDAPGTPLAPTSQQVTRSQSDRVHEILASREANREADRIEAGRVAERKPSATVKEPQITASALYGEMAKPKGKEAPEVNAELEAMIAENARELEAANDNREIEGPELGD